MPVFLFPFVPALFWLSRKFVDYKIDSEVVEGKNIGKAQAKSAIEKTFNLTIFNLLLNIAIFILFFLFGYKTHGSIDICVAFAVIIILMLSFIRAVAKILFYIKYAIQYKSLNPFTIVDKYLYDEVRRQVKASVGKGFIARIAMLISSHDINTITQKIKDFLKGELYQMLLYRVIFLLIIFIGYIFMYNWLFLETTHINFDSWYQPVTWAFKTIF